METVVQVNDRMKSLTVGAPISVVLGTEVFDDTDLERVQSGDDE